MFWAVKRKKGLDIDPYLCHCGPCVQFWKQNFSSFNSLKTAPVNRAADTSLIYAITKKSEDHPAVIRIGERVLVKGSHKGVVKYVGILDDHLIAPHCYIGVHLDDQVNSEHNGVYKGKRYFHCPRGHAAFVKYCDVTKIKASDKCPPVSGNTMYPHYKEMLQRRKARAQQEPTMAAWGPPFNRRVVMTLFDKNDIAAKDHMKSEQKKQMMQTQNKQVEAQREEFLKWKQKFGGDSRAETMAHTIQRLQQAHDKGAAVECEDRPLTHDRRHRQSLAYLTSRRVSTVR